MKDKHASTTKGLTNPVKKPLAKSERLIRLLGRAKGADLATLSKDLGWLPHTTRAAISRLRKAGHEITVEKGAKGASSRYKLQPAAQSIPENGKVAAHGA